MYSSKPVSVQPASPISHQCFYANNVPAVPVLQIQQQMVQGLSMCPLFVARIGIIWSTRQIPSTCLSRAIDHMHAEQCFSMQQAAKQSSNVAAMGNVSACNKQQSIPAMLQPRAMFQHATSSKAVQQCCSHEQCFSMQQAAKQSSNVAAMSNVSACNQQLRIDSCSASKYTQQAMHCYHERSEFTTPHECTLTIRSSVLVSCDSHLGFTSSSQHPPSRCGTKQPTKVHCNRTHLKWQWLKLPCYAHVTLAFAGSAMHN